MIAKEIVKQKNINQSGQISSEFCDQGFRKKLIFVITFFT